MHSETLGARYEKFVQEQVERGRFRNASEVIRAGLRLLEDQEMGLAARRMELRRAIDAAFDDPRPSLSAETVFEEIERKHALATIFYGGRDIEALIGKME